MNGTLEKTKDYDTCTHEEIVEHMARAFFACAWSDYVDEYTAMNLGGCDRLDVMPRDMDPPAIPLPSRAAACKWARELESAYGRPLVEIYQSSVAITGSDGSHGKTPEVFGHHVAMQAMGYGLHIQDPFGKDADEFEEIRRALGL